MSRRRRGRGGVGGGWGGRGGPGGDQGAPAPAALNRAQYASSSSTVRVVWTAMVAFPPAGILAEHAALLAVEAHAHPLAHLERLAGIDLDADACPIVERHLAVDDVAEEGHVRHLAGNCSQWVGGRRWRPRGQAGAPGADRPPPR